MTASTNALCFYHFYMALVQLFYTWHFCNKICIATRLLNLFKRFRVTYFNMLKKKEKKEIVDHNYPSLSPFLLFVSV